ncbi:MAG: hypothetical protein OXH68_14565 [Gammaproteobacteria bacterium]|nr:hypothetical protein [Gammaproteobacteria bacterium]
MERIDIFYVMAMPNQFEVRTAHHTVCLDSWREVIQGSERGDVVTNLPWPTDRVVPSWVEGGYRKSWA